MVVVGLAVVGFVVSALVVALVVGTVGASVVVSVSASVVVSCVVPLFSDATGVVLSAPTESLSAQELSKHRKRLIHKTKLIVLFTLITPF